MADLPTDRTPQVTIVDPRTGLPTKEFLQWLNALLKAARDHEQRITDLEP